MCSPRVEARGRPSDNDVANHAVTSISPIIPTIECTPSTQTTSHPFSLFALPNELLLEIAEKLPVVALFRLSLSCRILHTLLSSLCTAAFSEHSDHILSWAINNNAPHIFARVLADGVYLSAGHLTRILMLDHAALLPALFAAYPTFCSDLSTARHPPLHQAVHRSAVSCLVALLGHGVHPDLLDRQGSTALHIAAWLGAEDSVDSLLHAGARTDLWDATGLSALHYAASQNANSCVVALLRAGALPDAQDGERRTPLISAAQESSESCVSALLYWGALPDVQGCDGQTALIVAARRGYNSCVSALLRGGALPNLQDKFGSTALHYAASKGYRKCVSALLRAGAMPNLLDEAGRTPLHRAAHHSTEECVGALLCAGALPDLADLNGYTALFIALAAGAEGATWALIGSGAGRIVGPQVIAAHRGLVEQSWHGDAVLYAVLYIPRMVPVLAEAGWVGPNVKGGATPLQLAVRQGDLESVRVLIEYGADLDELGYRHGKNGWAPLHVCVRRWDEPIMDLLIEKGANLEVLSGVWADVTDQPAARGGGEGVTPLQLARRIGNRAAMIKLESHGARC